MSDTPETDALDNKLDELDREDYESFAPRRFRALAEKLERERDAARKDAERLATLLEDPLRIGGMDWPPAGWCEDARKALDEHKTITTP